MKKEDGGDVVGAALLIFLGLMFLANNFGLLPWSVWGTLWRFWPVFLILAGLQMFMGDSRGVRLLFFLFILLGLVGVVMYWVFSGMSMGGGWHMPMWRYEGVF